MAGLNLVSIVTKSYQTLDCIAVGILIQIPLNVPAGPIQFNILDRPRTGSLSLPSESVRHGKMKPTHE
jgi:hypothetical protein